MSLESRPTCSTWNEVVGVGYWTGHVRNGSGESCVERGVLPETSWVSGTPGGAESKPVGLFETGIGGNIDLEIDGIASWHFHR